MQGGSVTHLSTGFLKKKGKKGKKGKKEPHH
jgi:hypothetical protein